MEKQKYSIGELAELAGVSRRTVRFYVQSRLIPAPEGAGRGSYYTGRHLERILLIRAGQARSTSLHPVPMDENEPDRERSTILVRRIPLLEGVTLELSAGRRIPPEDMLREVARILARSTGKPDEEVVD
jgi:DNA-binding transcriptional MerR regulator